MPKMFLCEECGRSYAQNRTLQNHLLNKHPTKYTPRTFQFKCGMCNRRFNTKKNLDYHQRNVHDDNSSQIKLQCPMCEHTSTTHDKLIDHFKSQHELEIQIQNETFSSFSEFLTWKKEIEEVTNSSFSKKRFYIRTKERTDHYFYCSRSGHYVPSGEGKRCLKKGSIKINAVCPAQIIVRESSDGACSVTFKATHVGHQADLDHLCHFLTPSGEENLALQETNNEKNEKQKIPLDTIIDDVHDSICESGLERIHLLTKKDLHNIGQSLPKQNDQDFNFRKENLKRQCSDILEKITDTESLEIYEKTIKRLKITLETIVSGCPEGLRQNKDRSTPHNKKIQPQNRLFSTHKKTTKKKSNVFIPNGSEKQATSLQLLNGPSQK